MYLARAATVDNDVGIALRADEGNVGDDFGQGQDIVILQQDVRISRNVARQRVVGIGGDVAEGGKARHGKKVTSRFGGKTQRGMERRSQADLVGKLKVVRALFSHL